MRSQLLLALLAASVHAWTPHDRSLRNETGVVPRWLSGVDKIRGVNLGSAFIIERWMAEDEWRKMGCGNTQDEWSCVEQLGQSAADAAFKTHWDTWITQDDINKIVSLGLNTIRIPVGFWIFEDIVRDNEHYPRGGLQYLDRVVRQAKDAGLYIIMDLHGGPGSQQTRQQFTGHVVDYPEFYNADNFGRAALWLWRMAERIHTNPDYYNVGMLQVMNEPVHAWQYPNEAQKMIREFYPQALNSIRDAENSLGVSGSDRLHVQYMGNAWGSGDPTSNLPSTDFVYFDDHRYYKWDESVPRTKSGYISTVCNDNRGRPDSLIIGEWSISVADAVEHNSEFGIRDRTDQADWYRSYFNAQARTFEKSGGWVFWTWKCNWIGGMNEWRWCYESAVDAGAIPRNAASAASSSPC